MGVPLLDPPCDERRRTPVPCTPHHIHKLHVRHKFIRIKSFQFLCGMPRTRVSEAEVLLRRTPSGPTAVLL